MSLFIKRQESESGKRKEKKRRHCILFSDDNCQESVVVSGTQCFS